MPASAVPCRSWTTTACASQPPPNAATCLLKEVAAAETQRNAAAAAVEEALAAVEAIRADTEAKVQTASGWQAAKRAFEEAQAIATEAEKKAASSEDELGAKRKPYDDDPLFTYLWSRKFGTRDYQGGNFARLMDRIVADFIGFNEVRANYAALIEIPLRLREHATARRTEAAERQAALSDVERRAMLEAGIEPRERALAEARHKLAAADQTLEEKHGLLRKIEEERKTLVAGGSNPAYSQALETISSADAKDDLAQLYGEARRTPTSADDAIVRRLEAIDANVSKTDARGRQATPHGPGSRAAATRGAAGPGSLPRCRLRPSERDLRQRRRYCRCSRPRAPGRGQQRGLMGPVERRLQVSTATRQARLRRAEFPVSLSYPRRRHYQFVRRGMA